jgi:hypothetical protein
LVEGRDFAVLDFMPSHFKKTIGCFISQYGIIGFRILSIALAIQARAHYDFFKFFFNAENS